jgi:hypothetical protein
VTRPRGTPKLPSSTSTSGSGVSLVTGTILGISDNIAQVRLSMGNKIEPVRTDVLRAKGVAPKEGELWFMDQQFGSGWFFAAIVSYPGADALTWASPTLLGAWSDLHTGDWSTTNGMPAPVGYAREETGWVALRGTVGGGTVTASNAVGPISADIFALPDGYRPPTDGQQRFPVVSGSNAFGAVVVRPDGYVRAVAGSAASVSLDGCRFLAAQ